jgi:dihydropyrimidinase
VTFAPQVKTEPSLLNALKDTHQRAADRTYCDYSFHMLLSTPGEQALSEFPALREQGISSLKIYMTYEALQLRDNQILDVLLQARRHGITTMIHAENGDVLTWMTNALESRQLFAPKYHATSHPKLIEFEATNRAIVLSEIIDTPILIVHVSAPPAAKTIRDAQTRGLPVYAETCPQYLFLRRDDLAHPGFEGAKCVCAPPPRNKEDHEEIWTGLANGTFTVLSSDHCAFRYDDPESGKTSAITPEYPLVGRFKAIPNGCPGLETRLPLVWSAGRLTPQKFVEVTSTNAAKLYGLYPQKGALLPGVSDADLVIWYPDDTVKMTPFNLTNDMLHHNCDYTPYEGYSVTQWPRYTVLRGKVVFDRDNGGVVGEKGFGRFVKRGKSSLAGSRSLDEWDVEAF